MQSTSSTQPERAPSMPVTIKDRIREATSRRDKLVQLRTLRALEDEITRLEQEQATSPITPPRDNPKVTILALHKRDATSLVNDTRVKRTLHPKDPIEYKGKSLREQQEFYYLYKTIFYLIP